MTKSKIVHDSTKLRSRENRKIVLSWFNDVDADDNTLDNVKIETWSQLIVVYALQNALKFFSFDLSNRYDALSYKFSTSTQLYLDSSIDNVLICRIFWENSLVQTQTNVMLDFNREVVTKMLLKHRLIALRKFKKIYEKVKKVKRFSFEKTSFFAAKKRELARRHVL